MNWRDRARTLARFRGVPFEVEADAGEFGRRTVRHEYPRRDRPYVEDNGRKARGLTIIGYVHGDGYLARRDALIEAVERGGPGTLVHPFYGEMTVNAEVMRVTHSKDEGGWCRIELQVVESGALSFPRAAVDTQAVAAARADALDAAAADDFAGSFGVAGFPDFVAVSALDTLNAALDFVAGVAAGVYGSPFASALAAVRSALGTLIQTPLDLAGRVQALVRLWPGPVETVVRAADYRPVLPNSVNATAARQRQQRNAAAVAGLIRRTALAHAARRSARRRWAAYDDAMALRERLSQALDAEADDAPALYAPLCELCIAMAGDIAARVADASRLTTYTPTRIVPACTLAQTLYVDGARAGEITARNRVRHPLFVPPEPLTVLER